MTRTKTSSHTPVWYVKLFMFVWLAAIIVIGMANGIPVHSAPLAAYNVTLTANNFSSPLLTVTADNLSNPDHALFALHNGTLLWYGVTFQSAPAGLTPGAADTHDLVTNALLAPQMLLPPVGVLPFDQANGNTNNEALHLAVTFSGPLQQLTLTLSPLETHAVTLDIINLLIQMLGQQHASVQVGLLSPGMMQQVFAATTNMNDLGMLVNNYRLVLQSVSDTTKILQYAYACAVNLASLLADSSEQTMLADLLWNIMGKVVTQASILDAIRSIGQSQFGLAVEGFIANEGLALSTSLLQPTNPTILLQTNSTVTPTPSPTFSLFGPTTVTTPGLVTPILSPVGTATPTIAISATPDPQPTVVPTATAHP